MTALLAQAHLADADLSRVERAGLLSSQQSLARCRVGVVRSYRTGHAFSVRGELLNHLAPVMSRTLAVAHLMGCRRTMISAPRALSLDRFSEVIKQIRATGLLPELSRVQRGYARRVYDSLGQLGADADATTRALIGDLVASDEPPGRAMKILHAAMEKLGIGEVGQSRIETLYRTEAAIAYQAGRWAKVVERWDDVWGFRYVTMGDDRVRPEHAALEGTTLPKDHHFWQRWWPPNGWNCRCQVAVIFKTPGYKHKSKPPGKIAGQVPPPEQGFGRNFGEDLALSLSRAESAPLLALDWDESKHPRAPAGEHEGGQFTSEAPRVGNLKLVKSLGGSTGAELHEDIDTGKKYVLKHGASEAHVINEQRANELYRALGVPVPKSWIKKTDDGIVMISEFVEGKTLNQLSKAEQAAAEELLRKHFAADALLGNWDVIGLSKDNIVVDKNGVPWRVDNGGALAYRAKGSPKGALWNTNLGELDSMRQQGVAGEVFKGVTEQDIKLQGQHILNVTEKGSANFKFNQDSTLVGRLKALEKRVSEGVSAPIAPQKVATVATPTGAASFMGATLEKRVSALKLAAAKAGVKFNSLQLKKLAMINDGTNNSKIVAMTSLKQEQIDALKNHFGGLPVKLVVAKKYLVAKHGSYAKTSQMFKKLYQVTKEEKAIAVGAATTHAEKEAAEALEVVAAKPAEFLPGHNEGTWARAKVSNGDKVLMKLEEGNYADQYKNVEAFKQSLLGTESAAISTWKGSAMNIRDAMVKGALDNKDFEHHSTKTARQFYNACEKAPKYDGVSYRGVTHILPGTKFYDELQKIGNVVQLEAHACSSRSVKIGSKFAGNTCLMRIAGKSGAIIEDVQGYGHEHEVTLKRGTQYRVVGVAHNVETPDAYSTKPKFKKVALFVDLEEISAPSEKAEKLALDLLSDYPLQAPLAEFQ